MQTVQSPLATAFHTSACDAADIDTIYAVITNDAMDVASTSDINLLAFLALDNATPPHLHVLHCLTIVPNPIRGKLLHAKKMLP